MTNDKSGSEFRSFMTETRFGSTTPLGCVVQMLLTGGATTLVFWLMLTLA